MDVSLDSIRDLHVYQSKLGYRFSVDPLLLYGFVNLKRAYAIADLGAGTGIIGMLLAKKYPSARITLYEIQERLAKLAEENVTRNCLGDRVRVINCDIRTLPCFNEISGGFDLLVSNPPFRRLKSGRLNPEEERAIARHEIKLRLEDLVKTASFLLRVKGRFCVIYHPWRLSELVETLRRADLEPKRLRFVHSNISSDAKMILIEAVKNGNEGLKVESPLYLYDENGRYTEELQDMYAPNTADKK